MASLRPLAAWLKNLFTIKLNCQCEACNYWNQEAYTMPRRATPLEEMMLDELRHILVVLKDRMLTPKNYMDFMNEVRTAIQKAEKEIGD